MEIKIFIFLFSFKLFLLFIYMQILYFSIIASITLAIKADFWIYRYRKNISDPIVASL